MAKSPARTLLKLLAGVVGALVLLVVGLTLLLQTGAVSSRVKDLVVPRASAALGRQVTVEDAKLRIFPHTRVVLTGTTVAGRPGEPPLVQVEAFEVGVRLWPLLTSFGKDVQVSGIRLVRPVLNLVRAKDGTWNYQGLGGEPKEKPAPAPQPSEAQAKVLVDQASIEGGEVHYIDALLGTQGAVALSRIDFSAEHVGLGHPLDAKISAAVVNPEKNFEARVHASKLPERLAQLGPGEYPELQGDLALTGLDLRLVRAFLPPTVTNMMTGGKVDASAKLATREGKYAVDGAGKLSQVRLRGEPAQGSFDFHALVDPATGAGTASLEKLALKGPGIDLGGRLAADLKPQRVRFAIAGPLLDLGQVMSLLPQDKKKKSEGPILTAAQRKQVGAADVSGTIDIDKVVKGGLVATGFKAKAALEEGVFVLRDAQASFFGGRVDAAGTRVDLSQENPTWNLKAKLDAIDLGHALTSFTGAAPLAGKLTGALDLDGAGVDWATLQKALTGHGALSMKQAELTTTDLGEKVLGAVSQGLRAVGKTGPASTVGGAGGKTSLGDLAAQFTVKDGAMTLSRPVSAKAPFGAVELGGKIGLGGQLSLSGSAKLAKETLQRLAGGSKLPLGQGLSVPIALSGTLQQPSVSVQADQAVAGLVQGAVKQQVQQLQDTVQEKAKVQARKGLEGLLRGR